MSGISLEKRSAIIQRQQCCTLCGKSSRLTLHHIKPRRLKQRDELINRPQNLCVLCHECHRIVERLGTLVAATAVWLIAGPALRLARLTAPVRFWRVRRQLQTSASRSEIITP